MDNRFTREIIELHQFFVDWFSGNLEKTETSYARFSETVAEEFVLISPQGTLTPRESLLKGLYEEHGSRPDFRIWIENPQIRCQSADTSIVTYEEWQEINNQTTARLSTAVFQEQEAAPNGVVWLHVHETWLPGHQP